jgi:hypothetical protein
LSFVVRVMCAIATAIDVFAVRRLKRLPAMRAVSRFTCGSEELVSGLRETAMDC